MRSYRDDEVIPASVLGRIAARAKGNYSSQFASTYRESDDTGLTDWTHTKWCERLRSISASFAAPIDVLDLGCGTGRYFHCLQNVQSLTGVDISAPMLHIARSNPVRQAEITARTIDLIQGDALTMEFPEQSFDFVYSVGVLGDYAPLTLSLLQRIYEWLKPGGIAFVMIREGPPNSTNWKRKVAIFLYPVLPRAARVYIDVRIGDYLMSWNSLEGLLSQVSFKHFEIQRQVQRRIFLFATARK